MTRKVWNGWKCRLAVVALMAIAGPAYASDRGVTKTQEPADGHEVVEMFSAMGNGEIEVKLIAKSAEQANVIVTNNSDKPLSIKMPSAFAAVPVMAQGGGFGGGGFGGGGLGGGGGGGLFNIAPGKVGKVEVNLVCLEHGKNDPRPQIDYEIKPINSFTDDQRVIELCKIMGQTDIPQSVAQAAAWHMSDDLSWQELAAKDRVRLSNGYVEKFFNARDLYFAQQAVAAAEQLAKEYEAESTSGTSADTNR